jgi:hypothetical protein
MWKFYRVQQAARAQEFANALRGDTSSLAEIERIHRRLKKVTGISSMVSGRP